MLSDQNTVVKAMAWSIIAVGGGGGLSNQELSKIFSSMADMLAIQNAGYHRIMAYRRAAENVAELGRPIADVWRAEELESIPGVVSTLAAKI